MIPSKLVSVQELRSTGFYLLQFTDLGAAFDIPQQFSTPMLSNTLDKLLGNLLLAQALRKCHFSIQHPFSFSNVRSSRHLCRKNFLYWD